MIRWLISIGLHILANAVGLIIAAVVLSEMSLTLVGFIWALLIFTVVEVIAEPVIEKGTQRHATALNGLVALAATYLGLLIADLVSDGLTIEGLSTWVFATIIVWLAAMFAAWLLPIIFVKRRVDDRRDEGRGRTFSP